MRLFAPTHGTLLIILTTVVVIFSAQEIHVNQVGYEKTLAKSAIVDVSSWDSKPTSYKILAIPGYTEVASGTIDVASWETTSWYTNRSFARIDFTDFQEDGTYQIEAGNATSPTFKIGEDLLFTETFTMALDYFYKSRNAGQVWNQDQSVPIYDGTDWPWERADVSGGWYDASGDISKYLSHLQYANFMSPQQTPFVVWQMGYILDYYHGITDSINETGNLESELAFGADFLVRMKSDDSYFFTTVFDRWSGVLEERRVCAYSGPNGDMSTDYQAAFREGGGMAIAALAIASRLGLAGSYDSSDYIDAAEEAYAHLKTNNTSYCDNGTENIIDDYCALIAATELYKATESASYLSDARTRAQSIISRQHSEGWFYADGGSRPYYHAVEAGLPAIALAIYSATDTATDQSNTLNAIKEYVAHAISITKPNNPFGMARHHYKFQGSNKTAFFIPQTNETGYWWQGENARLGSMAALGFLTAHTSDDPDGVKQFAVDQLDWIMGKNPYGFCMMQGAGTTNPPTYGYTKYGHTDLEGGISNGIHSGEDGGEGIDFIIDDGTAPDTVYIETWRSSEQWIPHAAWYMFAIAALSGENKRIPSSASLPVSRPSDLAISGPVSVEIHDVAGRIIKRYDATSLAKAQTLRTTAKLASGVYFLKIKEVKTKAEIVQKFVR